MGTKEKVATKNITKKAVAKPFFAPNEKTVLVLRTCNADMTSCGGFVWPKSGPVEAPDWKNTKECGNGLHGFLWGEGDGSLASWDSDAVWLVVRVAEDLIVNLDGKVKFPRGVVEFAGSRLDATNYIAERRRGAIVGGTSTSGNYGTSTSGDCGTSTSGYYGTSTSGDGGTSTSGDGGTSTSGYGGTSTSGYHGTSTSGDRGTLVLTRYVDGRRRLVVLYVGEDGILPNVPYGLDKDGRAVRADGK